MSTLSQTPSSSVRQRSRPRRRNATSSIRIVVAVVSQAPPHTPRASSWFPSQSSWNVVAPAFVNLARSVANATFVEFPNAVVHVVADAIFIRVFCASPAAHAEGVELVPLAIAISGWNVVAPAIVHLARSVAKPHSSTSPDAVHVVADAILIVVFIVPPHTPRASSWFPSQSISSWNVCASTFVDVARSVANATFVEFAHAVVHVVADAIYIVVRVACTAAHV